MATTKLIKRGITPPPVGVLEDGQLGYDKVEQTLYIGNDKTHANDVIGGVGLIKDIEDGLTLKADQSFVEDKIAEAKDFIANVRDKALSLIESAKIELTATNGEIARIDGELVNTNATLNTLGQNLTDLNNEVIKTNNELQITNANVSAVNDEIGKTNDHFNSELTNTNDHFNAELTKTNEEVNKKIAIESIQQSQYPDTEFFSKRFVVTAVDPSDLRPEYSNKKLLTIFQHLSNVVDGTHPDIEKSKFQLKLGEGLNYNPRTAIADALEATINADEIIEKINELEDNLKELEDKVAEIENYVVDRSELLLLVAEANSYRTIATSEEFHGRDLVPNIEFVTRAEKDALKEVGIRAREIAIKDRVTIKEVENIVKELSDALDLFKSQIQISEEHDGGNYLALLAEAAILLGETFVSLANGYDVYKDQFWVPPTLVFTDKNGTVINDFRAIIRLTASVAITNIRIPAQLSTVSYNTIEAVRAALEDEINYFKTIRKPGLMKFAEQTALENLITLCIYGPGFLDLPISIYGDGIPYHKLYVLPGTHEDLQAAVDIAQGVIDTDFSGGTFADEKQAFIDAKNDLDQARLDFIAKIIPSHFENLITGNAFESYASLGTSIALDITHQMIGDHLFTDADLDLGFPPGDFQEGNIGAAEFATGDRAYALVRFVKIEGRCGNLPTDDFDEVLMKIDEKFVTGSNPPNPAIIFDHTDVGSDWGGIEGGNTYFKNPIIFARKTNGTWEIVRSEKDIIYVLLKNGQAVAEISGGTLPKIEKS